MGIQRAGSGVLVVAVVAAAVSVLAGSDDKVRVTGEVIESSCYIRMGAKGESHRKCAQLCADNGIPLALLEDGTEKVVWVGDPDHMSNPNKLLRKHIAKKVTVTGHYVERGGARLLIIESVEPVKPAGKS